MVPACSDCNKAKQAIVADNAAAQTLHPYYDNFDDAVWLRARVVEAVPPAVLFFVEGPAVWSEIKKQRITTHFTKFGLAELYGTNAARELSGIAGGICELADTVGQPEVQQHLEIQRKSREKAEINSWETAMYTALVESQWFCGGGYRAIRV